MRATPQFKEGGFFIKMEKEELEISDQNCINHHALYVDYNAMNALFNATKRATEAGVCLQKKVVPQNPLQSAAQLT